MPRRSPVEILNQLLALHTRSLPTYLLSAKPWVANEDAEAALAVLEQIAADQQLMAGRIVSVIRDEGGTPARSEFPINFTDMNDLSMDYIMAEVQSRQGFSIPDGTPTLQATDFWSRDPQWLRHNAYALAYWLHRHYFRVRSAGHEHIPEHGAGVVVGNHSGVLPFDAIATQEGELHVRSLFITPASPSMSMRAASIALWPSGSSRRNQGFISVWRSR